SFLDTSVVSDVSYFYTVASINPEATGTPAAPITATALSKQICMENNSGHAVYVYDATQSGFATPVRTIGGTAATLDYPATVASSLSANELYVMHRGGEIGVYPLSANGPILASRSLEGAVLPNAPSSFLLGLDIDEAAERLYTGGYIPAGRLLAIDAQAGAV